MLSSKAMISGDIEIAAACMFCRRCSTEEVPGMRRMLGERCRQPRQRRLHGRGTHSLGRLVSVLDWRGVKPPRGK